MKIIICYAKINNVFHKTKNKYIRHDQKQLLYISAFVFSIVNCFLGSHDRNIVVSYNQILKKTHM